MIDFHSHILPQMDDGSRDVEESLAMLRQLAQQGVTKVAATSHFRANDQSVSRFLERRQTAYEALAEHLTPDLPSIHLGAEVRYYQGISHLEGLRSLCLEGTNLLLLEMPESRWTEHTAREVVELTSSCGVTVVLAHIERCLLMQSREVRQRLTQGEILCQMNAEYLLNPLTRRKAMSLLRSGEVQFLGSDCHRTNYRPPCIGDAVTRIRHKLGEEFLTEIQEFGETFFL